MSELSVTTAIVKPSLTRYPMIVFYVESRKKRCSSATNRQCLDRLNTIFDQLTEKFGVVITDSSISGLNGVILQTWFNQFVDDRKPSTINNYLAFLNPFLRWAFHIGYMLEDLSSLLSCVRVPSQDELPEWERPKEKYLTHEQVYTILNDISTGTFALRNRALIALFLYSGLRVSEVCSLTIGSVTSRPRGMIYVRRKGGRWCDTEVGLDFYPYLDAYLATRTDCDDLSAPLFITSRGNPMDRYSVYAAIRPVQQKLGVATGPHALRHTYIPEVVKIGGPAIARDLANHRSMRITNRYDHTTHEQRAEAVAKLGWALPVHAAE